MSTTISRREWQRVLIFALVVLLLTSAPYLLAWAVQPADRAFSGFLIGADDGHSYTGKMRLGAAGNWAFHLFYTAEPHESAPLLFLPYILPGQIAGQLVHGPALTPALIGLFHLLRVVFGLLLIVVLYRFIAAYMSEGRFLALVLATFGGGLGWLLLLIGEVPPEFYIPEGFTLLVLFSLPHVALARAALLGGLLAMFAALGRRWPWAVLAGACWWIVGLAVPFYLVIIYAILGAWGLAAWLRARVFPWRLLRLALLAAGLTLPLFLYNLIVFTSNPAFAQWSAQNLLPSPPPLHYLLAYLPLAALALIGARGIWPRRDTPSALLLGWPLIVPLLVYLPINVQRRLAEAVIVPLAILAAWGVLALSPRLGRRRLLAGTLLLTTTSSGLLLLFGFLTAMNPQPPIALDREEIAAFNWLQAQAAPESVVLSAFETGNRIPAYTDLRVYLGHGPETLNAIAKTEIVRRFYATELDATEQAALLAQVDYVFFGPAERRLASGIAPDWMTNLTPVYISSDYMIFAVR